MTFLVNDDRAQMIIECVVENPECMAEMICGDRFWDYVPERTLEPFDRDAENDRYLAF